MNGQDRHPADTQRMEDAAPPARLVTVPNLLCMLRIVGAVVLIWLAIAEYPLVFIWLFAALLVTDWLDGKIAIIFDQRSVLGARLDSVADVILYCSLLIGALWLEPQFMRAHAPLIAAMLAAMSLSVVLALVRYRRLPAYHTRAAKTCWLLIAIGVITVFAGGPHWPAVVAIIAFTLANLEAIAMTLVLKRWHTDVPSIIHALRIARTEQ